MNDQDSLLWEMQKAVDKLRLILGPSTHAITLTVLNMETKEEKTIKGSPDLADA